MRDDPELARLPDEDRDIYYRLVDLDESEGATVSTWETEFLDSLLYRQHGPLSAKQRDKAMQILEKYGY